MSQLNDGDERSRETFPGECSLNCWAMPDCARCGLRKAPRGRSVPLPAAGGYCHCDGYHEPPAPGHFWPAEEPERKEAARRREEQDL